MPRTSRLARWIRDIAVAFLAAGCPAGSDTPDVQISQFTVFLPELPARQSEATLTFEVFFTTDLLECDQLEPMAAVDYPNPPVALALFHVAKTAGWPAAVEVPVTVPLTMPQTHPAFRVFGVVRLAGVSHASFCSGVVPDGVMETQVQLRFLGTRAVAPMATARSVHTATVLADGEVLVAGGISASREASLEIWNADAGFRTVSPLQLPRAGHTATLLADGRVLIAGGIAFSGLVATPRTELFDPATGLSVFAPSLLTPRVQHTATLLADGRVLVTGGAAGVLSGEEEFQSTELFEPDAGIWRAGPPMALVRRAHTATMLADGRVLLAGGQPRDAGRATELFDPAAETMVASGVLLDDLRGHFAISLADGTVLLGGGERGVAQRFDPATGSARPAGSPGSSPLFMCAALTDRAEVVAMGADQLAYRYSPSQNAWAASSALLYPRQGCAAWAINGGEVLVSGGMGPAGENAHATAEVVFP